ncbi:ribosomal protection-like ABC-F family protein [Ectobacillus polymachus]|uniref:ribosomal protection-like ABC-F family protein n=1 Tax=Ectobacillus polymachus TaxID=1508806 RepID=UPI003A89E9DF
MLLLEVNDVKEMIGERVLFQLSHAKLYEGDRIGIVGNNGAGKTTLLTMLASNHTGVIRYGSHSLIPQLEEEGVMTREFSDTQVGANRSGGEWTRAKIAAALESHTRILFADEPTSNLDMEGIADLEGELLRFHGVLVFISHDRRLLRSVATKIWEIEDGKVVMYNGNYDPYVKQKQENRSRHQAEYEQYQKKREQLLAAKYKMESRAKTMGRPPARMNPKEYHLYEGKKKSNRASVERAAKSIQSRLDKLKTIEKLKELPQTKMDIPSYLQLHARYVLQVKNANKSFGEKRILQDTSFTVRNKKRTALIGRNGSGKSTLLRMIVQGHGAVECANGVKIGYFSQNLNILQKDMSLLENVMKTSSYNEQWIRTILARLLFKREDVYKKIDVLSGGERVKAALAKVFLSDCNVLVLDEPTNYLDLASIEALEDVLTDYGGALLFVSHDHTFVERVAEEILSLENGKVTQFIGTLHEFEEGQSRKNDDRKLHLLQLETRLSCVLGRLCTATNEKEKAALEREYEDVLQQIKAYRNK